MHVLPVLFDSVNARCMRLAVRLVQGDVLVSEALATIFARQAERDGSPNRLAACFIHEVVAGSTAGVCHLATASLLGRTCSTK
jgi:hypothetical protein